VEIVRIFGDEAFEERGDNVVFADAVNELRVEILHLLAVAFVQDLFAIAFLDVALGTMAGGQAEQRDCTKSVAPEPPGGDALRMLVVCGRQKETLPRQAP
jgi:hypothetical protein